MARDFEIEYPLFVIGDPSGNPVAARVDDLDCVLVYTKRILAEAYLEQSESQDVAAIVDIEDAETFREMLEMLFRADIGHLCWDASLTTPTARMSRVEDELDEIR